MSKEQKLFAIWAYDQPPYYLGAEVIEVLEYGYVSVVGYGSNTFRYHKLYPLKEGKAIIAQLKAANTIYQAAEMKAHNELMKTVNKLVR